MNLSLFSPQNAVGGESRPTLYEAAALAIAEFRRCGFTANSPGPATRLTVTVKTPATSHEIRLGKSEAWLQSGGRSPNEQALKVVIRGPALGAACAHIMCMMK